MHQSIETPAPNPSGIAGDCVDLTQAIRMFIPLCALGQSMRGINHITTSWSPINGLFLHCHGFLKGCKYTMMKNASIVYLSFVFWTLHAGTGGIHKFLGCLIVSFSRSHFELFVVNARNSLKSLAVWTDSESEVERFITQTKAALVTIMQLSFQKNILNPPLRVQTTSKQLTSSILAPRIFRPTCMFTDKDDSRRGITAVTDKEIQSRNEARIPQNTKRSTTCLHGVDEFGMTG